MFNPPVDSLKPLPPDPRDFKLGAIRPLEKLENLPPSFSLGEPQWIGDQNADGNDDFCTAYASCGASVYQENEVLYPPYTFAYSKNISGDPDEWGQNIRDALKAQVGGGAIADTEVPEQVRSIEPKQRRYLTSYPVSFAEKASLNRKGSFFKIEGPYDDFDNARSALYTFREKKQAVIFGLIWSWGLDQYELTGTSTQGFGHCMYAYGYDGDYLLVGQSAGKSAGKNGTHKLHRDTYNAFAKTYGAFMLVDLEREVAQKMNKVYSLPWFIQVLYRLFT